MRDAAHIVRTERCGHNRFVIEQDPGAAFETGVALRFLEKDRAKPGVLRGDNFLVIPIGAFDEANGETRPAPPAPVDQVAQVALGIAQVSLDDDPDPRPVDELVLGKELLEEIERAVFLGVALHVEIDESADLFRPPENGAELGREMGNRFLGRGRVHLGIESGDLERKIDHWEELGVPA